MLLFVRFLKQNVFEEFGLQKSSFLLLLEFLPVEWRDLVHLDAELLLIGLNERSDFQASYEGCLVDIFLIGLVLSQLKSRWALTLHLYFLRCLYLFNRLLNFDHSCLRWILRLLSRVYRGSFSIPVSWGLLSLELFQLLLLLAGLFLEAQLVFLLQLPLVAFVNVRPEDGVRIEISYFVLNLEHAVL
jgi:hypothetical protein